MRANILNQEATLAVLTTLIRRFEQTIISTTDNLTNEIVSTGEIETTLITFDANRTYFYRAKTDVQLVS